MSGTIVVNGYHPPTVTLGPAEASATEGEFTIVVAGVDRLESLLKFQVVLQNYTSTAATILPAVTVEDSTNLGQSGGVTLGFDDFSDDGRFGAGDYFILSGVADGTSYRIVLFWSPTGEPMTNRDVPG